MVGVVAAQAPVTADRQGGGTAGSEADFKIALARLSSAFSRLSRLTSAESSVVTPGRAPASTSACRTHLWTVSGVPSPSSSATLLVAAHSDS